MVMVKYPNITHENIEKYKDILTQSQLALATDYANGLNATKAAAKNYFSLTYVRFCLNAVNKKIESKEFVEEPRDANDLLALGLSGAVLNILHRANITKISELKKFTDEDLLNLRNMGKYHFSELKTKLNEYEARREPDEGNRQSN